MRPPFGVMHGQLAPAQMQQQAGMAPGGYGMPGMPQGIGQGGQQGLPQGLA